MLKLKSDFIRLSVCLDDTSFTTKWLLFLDPASLHQLSEHIFEILQDVTVTEIQW